MTQQSRRVRGTAITDVSHSLEEKRVLTNLGDANLMPRAVTLGTGKDGTAAGKTDTVYISKMLSDSADQLLTLAHSLGRVPTWVKFWELESSTGAALVQSVEKTAWTKTTVRVRVLRSTGSGSLAGARLTLLVGG